MTEIPESDDAYSLKHRSLSPAEIESIDLFFRSLKIGECQSSEGDLEIILSTLELKPHGEAISENLAKLFVYRQIHFLLSAIGNICVFYLNQGDGEATRKAAYLSQLIYTLPELKGVKHHFTEGTTDTGAVGLGIDEDKWYLYRPQVHFQALNKTESGMAIAKLIANLVKPFLTPEEVAEGLQYVESVLGNQRAAGAKLPPTIKKLRELEDRFFRFVRHYRIPITPPEREIFFLTVAMPHPYHINKYLAE